MAMKALDCGLGNPLKLFERPCGSTSSWDISFKWDPENSWKSMKKYLFLEAYFLKCCPDHSSK